VSVQSFTNVSALQVIDLSYNNLSSIDINILKLLPKLSVLYLDGNPLHCDCQLQEVWRWCQDHNIETVYIGEAPECDTPSEVNGIWWGVLEKGQCLQDNINYYGDYKNTSHSYTPIQETNMVKGGQMDIGTAFGKNVSRSLKQYELPVSAVFFIFGTTGNIILIIIITCNKDMRTVPNMYILNLAISDIFYLTVLFSEGFADRIHNISQSEDIMCVFFRFCLSMSVGLSSYSVAMLSIQRYRVIVNPLHVRVSLQTTWRATGANICGVWIVAALFAVPAARLQCFRSIFLWRSEYYHRFIVFQLLVYCVLPFCVTAFSYIMIARHLLESYSLLPEETQISRLETRKTTAKVVLGLTVVFLISYVPYHVLKTYVFFSINWDNPLFNVLDRLLWFFTFDDIMSILKLFLSINPCLNPVALFCTSLAFRRQFKRYLTCCCKAKSPPNDFELTRRN
jgi:hypothetical protein